MNELLIVRALGRNKQSSEAKGKGEGKSSRIALEAVNGFMHGSLISWDGEDFYMR